MNLQREASNQAAGRWKTTRTVAETRQPTEEAGGEAVNIEGPARLPSTAGSVNGRIGERRRGKSLLKYPCRSHPLVPALRLQIPIGYARWQKGILV